MKKYIKNNRKALFLALVFSSLASIFAVRTQFIKGEFLDFAILGNFENSLKYAGYLALFIALELLCFYLYDISRGRFVVGSMKELRMDYFTSLLARTYPSFLERKQGDYLAQYTNEMEIIENQFFGSIPMLAEILIKILFVSISLFILDYRIAIISLFLLTMPLYIPKLVEAKLQGAQVEYLDSFEGHIRSITDWLKGFEMIKNFSIEKNIRGSFDLSNELVARSKLKKRQMDYLTRTISAGLSYFSHFTIVVFAGYLVIVGDFTGGDFFIAIGMIDQLSYPIISLSYFIQDLVSVKPVNRGILDFIGDKAKREASVKIDIDNYRQVAFKSVAFAYDGKEDIIDDLNMIFLKDKKYLLRGPSGSGKTTSMDLLLDYYKVKSGSISINGVLVGELENLNEFISIMRQDAVFFQDTLRNNITMYQEVDEEKLVQVLYEVGMGKYASEAGLDMLVSEGGTNLSGGEKRRLSLARCLLRKGPILILDEPLANLDLETAKSIESNLLAIENRTLIIISHLFSDEGLDKLDGIIKFA